MQIDIYTKFIMTVIAGALVVIALKGTGIIPTATAQSSGVQKIALCDTKGKCAKVTDSDGIKVYAFGSINTY